MSSDPREVVVGATESVAARPRRILGVHPAIAVAAVSFIALLGAAGFRAAPSVLMIPLQQEFGWSRSLLSVAVGVNLVLFGLTAPFAAALMERFGIRQVVSCALLLVAAGSGLTVFVHTAVAADPAVGRAGRAWHRLDGAGLRGHHRLAVVRQTSRAGDGDPHGRQRHRPADLPAGAGGGHRAPQLAASPRWSSRAPPSRWCRWC